MKKDVFNRTLFGFIKDALMPILFTSVIMVLIVSSMNQAKESSSQEGLKVLTEGLQRASTKCYAVEGAYPESLAYLEEHYGIFIDRTRYSVFYTVIATNYPPDITVMLRGGE